LYVNLKVSAALLAAAIIPSILLNFQVNPAQAQDGAGGAPAVEAVDGGAAPAGRSVPGTAEIRRESADNGQIERDERIRVAYPPDAPAVVYSFSSRHGTIAEAVLQNPRYQRDALPAFPLAPENKLAGGPIDLVSTWSTRWLPFHTVFGELAYPGQTTLTVRSAADGVIKAGQLAAPENRDALSIDRPVRAGDRLVITAPANLAATYTVKAVGAGGAVTPEPAFAVADITGVAYRLERSGEARVLFEADPHFTRVSATPGLPLVYVWPDPDHDRSPVWIERRFEAGSNPYELQLTVTVHNLGDQVLRVQPGVRLSAWQHPQTGQPSMFGGPTNILRAVCNTVDGREAMAFSDLHETAIDALQRSNEALALQAFTFGTHWVATDTNYFIQALAPKLEAPGGQCQLGLRDFAPQNPGAWVLWSTWLTSNIIQLQGRVDGCLPEWLPTTRVAEFNGRKCSEALKTLGIDAAGATPKGIRDAWSRVVQNDVAGADRAKNDLEGRRQAAWSFGVYNGPKETGPLTTTEATLTDAVDFGWMSFVGKPLHDVLVWLYEALSSWPVAIILLTIGLKLLTWPLTSKTYVSMQKMQAIKPKLDALKAKYGNDRQRFAQEQMALMKQEGVNPFAGCLPMLLQLPIWIGLYGAILGSVELYREPLGFWIQDLSGPDPYFVLPILEGLLMFAQTALTPSSAAMQGAQAKIMKYGMPIMFTVFMLFLPSGLVLYIIINTALTILQNLLIKRRMKTA
jgi:YidC/Oxa1 family membrane protein insertase